MATNDAILKEKLKTKIFCVLKTSEDRRKKTDQIVAGSREIVRLSFWGFDKLVAIMQNSFEEILSHDTFPAKRT